MRYLSRSFAFEASHRYWLPDASPEENSRLFGKCVSLHGHGHNYMLRVTLRGEVDPRTGMVINITALDDALKETVQEFDHKFINLDHPAFHNRVPTTENLASYFYSRAQQWFSAEGAAYLLSRIALYEEPTLWADVFDNTAGVTMVSLSKTFGFSAAHRLHSAVLSAEENRTVFGKCNNLHGHGHNYELIVTVSGDIDQRTGMLIDLGLLMQIVQDEIIERFDHKHLNEDTLEFRSLNPTGENIVKVIWDLLKPKLGARLTKLGLWETPRNFFEYDGV